MLVRVNQLVGCGEIPTCKKNAKRWIVRDSIGYHIVDSEGGPCGHVWLAELPDNERQAYLLKRSGSNSIPLGDYDDVAHRLFLKASGSMRAEAERKAAIVAKLTALIQSGASWTDRMAVLRREFGSKGTSKPSLKRLLNAVQGVDPINYAPALLAGYKQAKERTETTPEAWSMFLTLIRDAAPDFPIAQAWRDVRDVSKVKGWHWPPYVTINRRWNNLPKLQRDSARYGKGETAKAIALPAHRDKTTIAPLEWVSLDGRTLDFWVLTGEGKTLRLTMLALVDVASNMVLGYELAPSENAIHTVRLIRQVCETYGIFDQFYPDNGSAFAGHLVAGGTAHKFRNAASLQKSVRPFGICQHLGIDIHFALPGNAQAKIAERTFAALSRSIDDRPELKGAHAGHNPGAAPDSRVVPVRMADAEALIRREVTRHNDEAGRRSQGAQGRSYSAVFADGLAERIVRKPTARQLYLASLIYAPVAVNRRGQIVRDHWVYGGPSTQVRLMDYHGGGQRILLARDPDDLTAPAMAFDAAGNLICEGIEPIERGRYDSVEGIKAAASNRKAARKAVAEADAANAYMNNADFTEALKALDAITPAKPVPASRPAKVVGGRFGAPVRERAAIAPSDDNTIPAEFWDNFDAHTASKRGGGKPT